MIKQVIIVLLILLIVKIVPSKILSTIDSESEKYILDSTSIGTIQKLASTLQVMGIRHPDVVIAQVLHETGKLSSPVYRECNNITGMKHNSRGISKGVCRGHAMYDSIYDCLIDYKLWQDRYIPRYTLLRGDIDTDEEYVDMLIFQDYAEDDSYRQKVLYWLNIVKQLKSNKV